jgi:hypothetical protein
MNREIPGFYYDPDKKKYFKIQASHKAAPGAQYSKDAVKRKRVEHEVVDLILSFQMDYGTDYLIETPEESLPHSETGKGENQKGLVREKSASRN